MKSTIKRQLLTSLSTNLEMFIPEHKNKFKCPTCMRVIPIDDLHEISEAHIIPKSAKGTLKTFLCRECNSNFGTKQDKWFGEMIRIAKKEHPSILATQIREGYFMIDGIKVNGYWKQTGDNKYCFYIYVDRNAPDVNKLIDKKFGEKPPEVQLSIPLPILTKQRLIKIGYLTSAYLMWFRMFGYSWALQEQLNTVREQIRKPDEEIITHEYLFGLKLTDWNPWIGLISISGNVFPAFSLDMITVILPPAKQTRYYELMKSYEKGVNISQIKIIKFPDKALIDYPVMIIYDDIPIVCPMLLNNVGDKAKILLFREDCQGAQLLSPVGEEEFKELAKLPNSKYVEIKI